MYTRVRVYYSAVASELAVRTSGGSADHLKCCAALRCTSSKHTSKSKSTNVRRTQNLATKHGFLHCRRHHQSGECNYHNYQLQLLVIVKENFLILAVLCLKFEIRMNGAVTVSPIVPTACLLRYYMDISNVIIRLRIKAY